MKKFISILGIGKYEKAKYFYKDKQNFVETRFIQEATLKLLCNDFNENDKILIFLTDKARSKNWKQDCENNYEGLSSVLSNFAKQTKAELIDVEIPDGNNEKELWIIFETIYEKIKNEDELYVDITHSFRSLPMFLLVLLNYSKVLKNTEIKSITYGNWEGRNEHCYAPIVELLPLSILHDWTIAAHNFTLYGKANHIKEFTKKEIHPILTHAQGKNEIANTLRNFSNKLDELSLHLETARGIEILNFDFDKLFNHIEYLTKSNFISQLNPLLQNIKEKLSVFQCDNQFDKLFKAAKWCANNNLYQQAYSFFIEAIITKVCVDLNFDYTNLKTRLAVSKALQQINNKTSEGSEIEQKINEYFKENKNQKLLQNYTDISDLRNDFMHAGFRENSAKSKTLVDKIKEIIKEY